MPAPSSSSSRSPTRRRRSPKGRKATPPRGRSPTKRRRAQQSSTSPADSDRRRAARQVKAATAQRRSRSKRDVRDDLVTVTVDDSTPAQAPRQRLPPVPPQPKCRPERHPSARARAQQQPATSATAQADNDDTDEETDPWWQAQADRWKSWQASGAASKRDAAKAWWREERTASYSMSAGVRCRHCAKLCVNSAALRRHQEASSRCLQAQGWLSWSRTPCSNNCGRYIATGDGWALQQHLQHCPNARPPAGR